MKIVSTLASAMAVATVGVTLIAGTTAPAHAAYCTYKAVTLDGRYAGVQGNGNAFKRKNACKRARRKCNRRLERAFRKGKMPRGVVCKRVGP